MNETEIRGEEFIRHFGTRGMKWGVRKDKKIRVDSEDYQRFKANKKKKPSELSDKELKDTISRMNMNKQMNNLSPSKVKKGHNSVKEIIAISGSIAAVVAVVTVNSEKIKKYVDTVFEGVNFNPSYSRRSNG